MKERKYENSTEKNFRTNLWQKKNFMKFNNSK